MLWEKKTKKQIQEKLESRGYLYLRESVYVRDKRSLMRNPKHLSDGSRHKERNKYIKKKDVYLGKIREVVPNQFLMFQDYIITILEKDSDYLSYVLHNSFEEIFFDFVSYLQEMYDFDVHLFKEDILDRKEDKKSVTYELKTGGFFNQYLFQRAFFFQPKIIDEVSYKDFEHFSMRCIDSGIYDEYIQIVLYSKLIQAPNLQELEEEIAQLQIDNLNKNKEEVDSFEKFMRRMHQE